LFGCNDLDVLPVKSKTDNNNNLSCVYNGPDMVCFRTSRFIRVRPVVQRIARPFDGAENASIAAAALVRRARLLRRGERINA
jgi:hypothetical protein